MGKVEKKGYQPSPDRKPLSEGYQPKPSPQDDGGVINTPRPPKAARK